MIDGILAGDPLSGGATDAIGATPLDKDAFMQLLVAQMRNQDPMAPVDNQEFIAQLAQFSALEEMQGVNENLVALALLQESNALLSQLTDSSALIGKRVVYTHPETGSATEGVVESVVLSEGAVRLRIDGGQIPLMNVTEVVGDASQD